MDFLNNPDDPTKYFVNFDKTKNPFIEQIQPGIKNMPLSSDLIKDFGDYTGGRIFSQDIKNYEDIRAMHQSGWDKFGNALVKLGITAGTTAMETFTLPTIGLGTAISEGRFSGFYENEASRWFHQMRKNSEIAYPNYYTKEEANTPFYEAMFTYPANFWFDKFLKNSGFTIGMIMGGMGFSAALRGLTGVAKYSKIGKMANDAGKITAGLDDATIQATQAARIKAQSEALMKMYPGLNNAEQLSNLAATIKMKNSLINAGSSFVAAGAEASVEALSTIDELKAMNPLMSKEELIKAGNFVFAMNLPLLMVSNYIQFKNILTRNFDPIVDLNRVTTKLGTKKAISELTKEELRQGGLEQVKSKVWKTALAELGKRAATEGMWEEMGQRSMANAAKILAGKYQGDYALGNVLSAIKDGYGNTFTSEKGWEEGFLGALTSIIPFGGKRTGILAPFQSSKEMEQNTEALLSTLNEDAERKFKIIYDNANLYNNEINNLDNADTKYKQFVANENLIANQAKTFGQLGRTEILKEMYNSMRGKSAEDLEFLGLNPNNVTTKEVNNVIDGLIEKIDTYSDRVNSINYVFNSLDYGTKETLTYFSLQSLINERFAGKIYNGISNLLGEHIKTNNSKTDFFVNLNAKLATLYNSKTLEELQNNMKDLTSTENFIEEFASSLGDNAIDVFHSITQLHSSIHEKINNDNIYNALLTPAGRESFNSELEKNFNSNVIDKISNTIDNDIISKKDELTKEYIESEDKKNNIDNEINKYLKALNDILNDKNITEETKQKAEIKVQQLKTFVESLKNAKDIIDYQNEIQKTIDEYNTDIASVKEDAILESITNPLSLEIDKLTEEQKKQYNDKIEILKQKYADVVLNELFIETIENIKDDISPEDAKIYTKIVENLRELGFESHENFKRLDDAIQGLTTIITSDPVVDSIVYEIDYTKITLSSGEAFQSEEEFYANDKVSNFYNKIKNQEFDFDKTIPIAIKAIGYRVASENIEKKWANEYIIEANKDTEFNKVLIKSETTDYTQEFNETLNKLERETVIGGENEINLFNILNYDFIKFTKELELETSNGILKLKNKEQEDLYKAILKTRVGDKVTIKLNLKEFDFKGESDSFAKQLLSLKGIDSTTNLFLQIKSIIKNYPVELLDSKGSTIGAIQTGKYQEEELENPNASETIKERIRNEKPATLKIRLDIFKKIFDNNINDIIAIVNNNKLTDDKKIENINNLLQSKVNEAKLEFEITKSTDSSVIYAKNLSYKRIDNVVKQTYSLAVLKNGKFYSLTKKIVDSNGKLKPYLKEETRISQEITNIHIGAGREGQIFIIKNGVLPHSVDARIGKYHFNNLFTHEFQGQGYANFAKFFERITFRGKANDASFEEFKNFKNKLEEIFYTHQDDRNNMPTIKTKADLYTYLNSLTPDKLIGNYYIFDRSINSGTIFYNVFIAKSKDENNQNKLTYFVSEHKRDEVNAISKFISRSVNDKGEVIKETQTKDELFAELENTVRNMNLNINLSYLNERYQNIEKETEDKSKLITAYQATVGSLSENLYSVHGEVQDVNGKVIDIVNIEGEYPKTNFVKNVSSPYREKTIIVADETTTKVDETKTEPVQTIEEVAESEPIVENKTKELTYSDLKAMHKEYKEKASKIPEMKLDEAIVAVNAIRKEASILGNALDDATFDDSGKHTRDELIRMISVSGDLILDTNYYDSLINFYNNNYTKALNKINEVIRRDTNGKYKYAAELKEAIELKIEENPENENNISNIDDVDSIFYTAKIIEEKEYSNKEREKKYIANVISMIEKQYNTKENEIKIEYISSTEAEKRKIKDNVNAYWQDKTLFIIEDRVTVNTAIHEFLHPFINILYNTNKSLYNKLASETKKDYSQIFDLVNKNYPEGVAEKEAIIYAVQSEMAKLTKNTKGKNIYQKFIDWIKELITKSIKNLSYIFGNKQKAIASLSNDLTIEDIAKLQLISNFSNTSLLNDTEINTYFDQIQTMFNFSILLDNKAKMESFDKFTKHIVFNLIPSIENQSKNEKTDESENKIGKSLAEQNKELFGRIIYTIIRNRKLRKQIVDNANKYKAQVLTNTENVLDVEEEAETETETKRTGDRFEKDGINLAGKTNDLFRKFIESTYRRKVKYNKKNIDLTGDLVLKSGLPVGLDYNTIFIKLSEIAKNSPNFDIFYDKLKSLSKEHPHYYSVYRMLEMSRIKDNKLYNSLSSAVWNAVKLADNKATKIEVTKNGIKVISLFTDIKREVGNKLLEYAQSITDGMYRELKNDKETAINKIKNKNEEIKNLIESIKTNIKIPERHPHILNAIRLLKFESILTNEVMDNLRALSEDRYQNISNSIVNILEYLSGSINSNFLGNDIKEISLSTRSNINKHFLKIGDIAFDYLENLDGQTFFDVNKKLNWAKQLPNSLFEFVNLLNRLGTKDDSTKIKRGSKEYALLQNKLTEIKNNFPGSKYDWLLNKLVLPEGHLADIFAEGIELFKFNGVENKIIDEGSKYKSMMGQEKIIADLIIYNQKLYEQNGLMSVPLPIMGDSSFAGHISMKSFIDKDEYVLAMNGFLNTQYTKGNKKDKYKIGDETEWFTLVKNTVYGEIARMKYDKDLIDRYEKGESVVLYDLKHGKITKDGFVTKDTNGKYIGKTFEFHTFQSLNKKFDVFELIKEENFEKNEKLNNAILEAMQNRINESYIMYTGNNKRTIAELSKALNIEKDFGGTKLKEIIAKYIISTHVFQTSFVNVFSGDLSYVENTNDYSKRVNKNSRPGNKLNDNNDVFRFALSHDVKGKTKVGDFYKTIFEDKVPKKILKEFEKTDGSVFVLKEMFQQLKSQAGRINNDNNNSLKPFVSSYNGIEIIHIKSSFIRVDEKRHPEIYNFLKKNNIDGIVFKSAFKEGATNQIVDLFDENGTIKSDFELTDFNKMQFNLSDYFEQQVLPRESHQDRRLSTQIENIGSSGIIENVDYEIGLQTIKGEDLKNVYTTIYSQILKKSFTEWATKNNIKLDKNYNIEKVDLNSMVNSIIKILKSRGKDIKPLIDSLSIIQDKDGNYVFEFPNISTSIIIDTIQSELKENAIRVQTMGAHLIAVPSMTNELTPIIEGKKIIYPIKIPKNNKLFKSIDNIESIPVESREMLMYRVPLSGKAMQAHVRVIGFLESDADSIYASEDLINKMGFDFDIDTFYFFQKELEVVKKQDSEGNEIDKIMPVQSYFDSLPVQGKNLDESISSLSLHQLKNSLLDFYIGVMQSEHHIKEALNPSEYETSYALATEINKVLGELIDKSFTSVAFQKEIMNVGVESMKLLDIAVFSSVMFQYLERLNIKSKIDIKAQSITLNNLAARNSLTDVNYEKDNASQLNEIVSHVVDAMKFNIPLTMRKPTIVSMMYLIKTGMHLPYVYSVFAQSSIYEYVNSQILEDAVLGNYLNVGEVEVINNKYSTAKLNSILDKLNIKYAEKPEKIDNVISINYSQADFENATSNTNKYKNLINAIDKLNDITVAGINLESLNKVINTQIKSLVDSETNIIANEISNTVDNYEEKRAKLLESSLATNEDYKSFKILENEFVAIKTDEDLQSFLNDFHKYLSIQENSLEFITAFNKSIGKELSNLITFVSILKKKPSIESAVRAISEQDKLLDIEKVILYSTRDKVDIPALQTMINYDKAYNFKEHINFNVQFNILEGFSFSGKKNLAIGINLIFNQLGLNNKKSAQAANLFLNYITKYGIAKELTTEDSPIATTNEKLKTLFGIDYTSKTENKYEDIEDIEDWMNNYSLTDKVLIFKDFISREESQNGSNSLYKKYFNNVLGNKHIINLIDVSTTEFAKNKNNGISEVTLNFNNSEENNRVFNEASKTLTEMFKSEDEKIRAIAHDIFVYAVASGFRFSKNQLSSVVNLKEITKIKGYESLKFSERLNYMDNIFKSMKVEINEDISNVFSSFIANNSNLFHNVYEELDLVLLKKKESKNLESKKTNVETRLSEIEAIEEAKTFAELEALENDKYVQYQIKHYIRDIAIENLEKKHKDEGLNYKPSPEAIATERKRIISENNIELIDKFKKATIDLKNANIKKTNEEIVALKGVLSLSNPQIRDTIIRDRLSKLKRHKIVVIKSKSDAENVVLVKIDDNWKYFNKFGGINFVETGDESILNSKIELAEPSEYFKPIEIAKQYEIHNLIQNELINAYSSNSKYNNNYGKIITAMRSAFGSNTNINSQLYDNGFFKNINFANDNIEDIELKDDKVFIKFKGIEKSLEINDTATKPVITESVQKEIDIAASNEKQATENENYNKEKC